jgi:hypothetical protein
MEFEPDWPNVEAIADEYNITHPALRVLFLRTANENLGKTRSFLIARLNRQISKFRVDELSESKCRQRLQTHSGVLEEQSLWTNSYPQIPGIRLNNGVADLPVLDSELDENNHAYYTAVLVTGDWAPM